MAWEGARIGSARRMRLAQLVLLHRVLPRDPLADDAEPRVAGATLDAAPIARRHAAGGPHDTA